MISLVIGNKPRELPQRKIPFLYRHNFRTTDSKQITKDKKRFLRKSLEIVQSIFIKKFRNQPKNTLKNVTILNKYNRKY